MAMSIPKCVIKAGPARPPSIAYSCVHSSRSFDVMTPYPGIPLHMTECMFRRMCVIESSHLLHLIHVRVPSKYPYTELVWYSEQPPRRKQLHSASLQELKHFRVDFKTPMVFLLMIVCTR